MKYRLLGYYNYPNQYMAPERKFPEDAAALAPAFENVLQGLLDDELIDDELKRVILDDTVFIFKDEDGDLYGFFTRDRIARISGVVFDKNAITQVSRKYKQWFKLGERIKLIEKPDADTPDIIEAKRTLRPKITDKHSAFKILEADNYLNAVVTDKKLNGKISYRFKLLKDQLKQLVNLVDISSVGENILSSPENFHIPEDFFKIYAKEKDENQIIGGHPFNDAKKIKPLENLINYLGEEGYLPFGDLYSKQLFLYRLTGRKINADIKDTDKIIWLKEPGYLIFIARLINGGKQGPKPKGKLNMYSKFEKFFMDGDGSSDPFCGLKSKMALENKETEEMKKIFLG